MPLDENRNIDGGGGGENVAEYKDFKMETLLTTRQPFIDLKLMLKLTHLLR